jgi:hypothetical protein
MRSKICHCLSKHRGDPGQSRLALLVANRDGRGSAGDGVSRFWNPNLHCGLLCAVKASPSDHIAAPSRTTSFIKNWPTAPERAGKPPRLGSHPGVENKNESVVRNISTATALPIAAAFRDQGRRAIKMAMEISTTPNPVANCRRVHMRYIQANNGLCATSGSMPCACISGELHHAYPADDERQSVAKYSMPKSGDA